jgi:signal transduction histidine kinase
LTADFSSKDIYELVNSINDLLNEYQKSIRDAEKKNLAVKETITNIAHDLRTPLTAISGYSQMLLKSPNLKPQDVENVSVILERINALNMLLNQLFEFARLESGEIRFTNTNVNLNAILKKDNCIILPTI